MLCFGGEPFPEDLNTLSVDASKEIYNLYGVTEISCWSSIHGKIWQRQLLRIQRERREKALLELFKGFDMNRYFLANLHQGQASDSNLVQLLLDPAVPLLVALNAESVTATDQSHSGEKSSWMGVCS